MSFRSPDKAGETPASFPAHAFYGIHLSHERYRPGTLFGPAIIEAVAVLAF
jgi:hypothetical protein